MQPPPRTGLPGASGPPPPGAGPNAFRRNRPHKHTSAAASAAAMSGPPPPAQPMTDPFAFVRQAPPPMTMGGHPVPPNSSHSPMQAPHPGMFSQPGAGPGMPSQPLEGGAQALPPPSSTPGVSLFTPQSTASPVPFPGQPPYHPPPGPEQGYFNSRDPTPSVTPGPPPLAPAPLPGQAPYIQGYQGNPSPQTVPFQLVPPSSNQWAPDQVNRPPSVQNYFQPTSDPPPQSFSNPPQSNMAPHPHSPHHAPPTPPHPQSYPNPHPPPQHPDRPSSSQWPDPGGPANSLQQHNSHFQAQSYFSQSSGPQDWFNQPLLESAYHQMGAGPGPGSGSGLGLTGHDSTGSNQGATPSLAHYTQDSGTISMFFKGNDVENEETLAGEGLAVNGIQGHPEDHQQQQHPHPAPGPEVTQGYHGAPAHADPSVPYMNDGNYAVPPMNPHAQKPTEPQFDHVENLECVPNQEVLPSEPQSSPASQGGDRYEPGPNLETPDSVARPMRSASVSSSYSNVSHGSGTGPGPRRHQGVVGTFIQQESPRPSDDALSSAAAGGYFEQIDTSPAGDVAGAHHQSPQERMYHSQTPTPSPPKPTGIFQASANSSFEPVRSHSVGVRPAEVDRARMVAERGTDAVSGNLEQPPDNLENVYGAGAAAGIGPGPGAGLPLLTHPLGLPHSRPSSRAHVAQRPCESPATTLWAQNDPASLGASILLAPAAPPVLAPLREPSSEVIQPPEDGPLDLQPPQRGSENMENPPQVSEGLPEPQAHMGYASLLVADSLHQPILIAPPASNYSVIAPQAANLSSPRETTPPVRPPSQPPSANLPPLGPLPLTSNPNQIFAPPPVSFCSAPTGQSPLNLARDSRDGAKQETPPPLSQFRPPLSRGQSVGGDSHASLPVNSHAPPAATAASSTNHNQPSNFELLDFSMHQSQIPNQATCPPPTSQGLPLASNAPGFYLQVTKDAQQGALSEQTAPPVPVPEPVPSPAPPSIQQVVHEPLKAQDPRPGPQSQRDTALALTTAAPPSLQRQHPPPAQGPPAGNGPPSTAAYPPGPPGQVPPSTAAYPPGPPGQVPPSTAAYPPRPPGQVPPSTAAYPPGPPGQEPPVNPQQQPGPPQPGTQPAPTDPPRPPSSLGSQQGYGPLPPVPGQVYGGYYGGTYPEYPDGRAAYPPGQYPPPPVDPRAQQYYQDDPYRRADPRYPRYEGPNPAYRDPGYREPPAERPSSRTSQYSDRPSSRQGYPEDYQRANRSAYDDYYAEYYKKQYDYGDRSRWEGYNTAGAYDPRYHGYYDQSYWYNYDPEAYRARDPYYQHTQQQQQPPPPQQPYPARREGYEDPWRYYPGYDSSFDDDYRRQRDAYGEEFDRRSLHSEQSAHSIHSSHSHHSRRSSFSSRSQQSQVYRSQPDLVAAAYDATSSTLAADYSYAQYPDQADATQNYGQYPYTGDYTTEGTWPAAEQPPPRPVTPEKYSVPHRCARFGPGGQLIQVLPNLPSAGQPALVEIHNMETMLQDSSDQAELRTFPGPLVREETHKVDVIKFAQNKAMECSRSNDLVDKDSACLLWDFIVLLCRQNGTVVGTDIADLLLKEHRSVWLPGKSPNEANLIDFNNEPLARAEEEPGAGPLSLLSDTFMTVPENVGKETERFRELLLFGRKKDALEAAMKVGLWGHALLLASKMDNRTHARVMTRFANSLPINDPLQTVYQLMSGRMPASATCCGDEKWGDWRPHLAMVLSNLTHTLDLDTRTITTMGDTLASKGLFDAAHFCYLMAQVGLGVFTKKSTKMVLVGSNHSLPFYQFATNEAIQRTEAYEYAQSLGSQPVSLPNFQVFKLVYACRLAEAGLCAQAFHYCEVISRSVLMQPSYHSPVFISQLIQMSEKLRFFDPQLKERPEQELFNEPDWLIHLRQLDGQIRTGVISYNADRATPQPYDCSTPSSELDQASPSEPYAQSLEMDGPTPNNPLMSSLLPGPPPQAVQLMPPAPTNILQDGLISQPQPSSDGIQLYPAVPSFPGPGPGPGPGPTPGYSPQAHGFAAPYQHQPSPQQHLPPEQPEMYPGQQTGPPQMGQPPPPQMGQPPPSQMGQPPPPQMQHPPPPPQQQPQVVPQQMLSHMYPGEPSMPPPQDLQQPCPMPASPVRNTFSPQMDFYDQMAHMGPGRRSRTTSQSSMHMGPPGRRSRTVSESSTHSGGRERSNSAVKQSSPAPPSIPEQPRKAEPKKPKKDSPKKGGGGGGGGGWLNWLYRKGKNEAHLPDDKNKSIVWDEDKQKWVNMEEPEEESKPPPPPPSGFPKMAPMAGPPGGPGAPPGGGPPVNMFSRRAGTKSRYVDVMNPGGRSGPKPGGSIPAPADLFAPLAPMPMPANLFVPGAASEEQQPLEGSVPEMGASQEQGAPNPSAVPQMFNPTLLPPGPEGPTMLEGTRSGELSRSSSMSSLSREVSQHLNQAPPAQGAPPSGGVTFYNPAQFAQASAPSGAGRQRLGRLGGQREYPTLK